MAARKKTSSPAPLPSGKQRVQRVLAAAGLGSRRQCEEYITAGRVEVDGEVVDRLGSTVDPATSEIRVDGTPLRMPKPVYFLLNKPVGVVTTNRDPMGRPRVIDLIPPEYRVFPVGRLDRSSEGLILLTNDGALADQLTHPRYGVLKVYHVTVAGEVSAETMRQMRQGIFIAEGRVRVEGAKIRKARGRATDMEITLREGKNREIRRILARLGHKVQQLRRVAIGPLKLGQLPSGAYRQLSFEEVKKLKAEAEAGRDRAAGKGPAAGGRPARKTVSRGKPGGGKAAGKSTAGKKNRGGPAATGSDTRKRGGRPPAAGGKRTPRLEFDLSAPPQTGAVIGDDQPAETRPRKAKPKSKPHPKTARGGAKGSRRGGRSAGGSAKPSTRKHSPRKKKGR